MRDPLFHLDAKGRWRLSYDQLQWILERRRGLPRHSDRGAVRKSGWEAVSFIASTKHVLHRVLREKRVTVTPTARAR
jgi:hypothetical protein